MRVLRLSHVRLVVTDESAIDHDLLTREMPTVDVETAPYCGVFDAIVDVQPWRAGRDFQRWDEAVEASRSEAITVRGPGRDLASVAFEVLGRYQRHVHRRNEASSTPTFDAVLRAHAGLHDCHKPLARAGFEHALDRWHWMLRLDARASFEAQVAALFHEVESVSEALVAAGVGALTAERVEAIVRSGARRGRDAEVDLLHDADGLSFFSLRSDRHLDAFGAEQTRQKLRTILERLGPSARARLEGVRLRHDVHPHVTRAVAA